MEEGTETKIKAIEEKKYNIIKNWILGISAAVIMGSSWYGFRSLDYADQMESMNPYADSSIESLMGKTASDYLNVKRRRLWKIKGMLERTEFDLVRAYKIIPKIYFKELEETVEEEFKFANDDFIKEEQKSKNAAFYVDKENEWNKVVRKNRKIGTALYFVPLIVPLVAGALLALNRAKKEDEVKPYLK